MFPYHMENVVRKYEAPLFSRDAGEKREEREMGLNSKLQGFRGHPGPCTPHPPFDMKNTPVSSQVSSHMSTLVQTEFLSLAPKTPVYLIYVSSLLALSSLVNYLFMLFAYFSAGTFPLSD